MTGNQGSIDRAVPNLPSRDFGATERFYGALGFERLFRDDGWMVLRRPGGLQLEFFPAPDVDPLTSSFMCCLRVADVDALYAAAAAAGVPEGRVGYPRLHRVTQQGWGQRAGALIDLDGTQLTLIGEP